MTEGAVYVICYDVATARRRSRLAKWLEAFGTRVQKSVFEAWLSYEQKQRFLRRALRIISDQEDSLSLYRLSASAGDRVERFGRHADDSLPSEQPFLIV